MKLSPVLDWSNIGLRNEFVTKPLDQQWAEYSNNFRRLFFTTTHIPNSFVVKVEQPEDDGLLITAESLGYGSFNTGAGVFPDYRPTSGLAVREGQRRLCRSLESLGHLRPDLAEFGLEFWEQNRDGNIFELTASNGADNHNERSRFDQIRSDLQMWLEVSVDELARLLDLSPTTIINMTKPGRNVRPRTARKLLVVHGLVRELQRTIGAAPALTWTRTTGRRLLAEGRLIEFEQFVSTHIFPAASQGQDAVQFGRDDIELATKELRPVGKSSRF
jgi:hypothetical protein